MAVTKPDLRRTWAAGAPAANVQDPDSVVPGKYNSGWEEEIPPFEFFNFIQQLMTQGLAHLNERGIPEWDADTEYLGGRSYVTGSNGDVYVAVIDNSGNDPVSDGDTNWITLRDYIIDSLTASEVGYDNTLSGLTAADVQEAIDEIVASSSPSQDQTTWNIGTDTTESLISPAKLDAKIKTLAIGEGQTWQNVSGSRSAGVVYTNTSGRTISVSIAGIGSSVRYFQVSPDGISWIDVGFSGSESANGNDSEGTCFVVPDGWQYRINGSMISITVWSELR